MAIKNPNPSAGINRKVKPLQQGYNLDNNDPATAVKDIIRKRFTSDIFDVKNDVIAKVLTNANNQDETTPDLVSVRARVRKVHDYLPIPQAPPDDSTNAGRMELAKVFLHPEFTSTNKNDFSDIGPGTEIIGEMQFPDVPFEYANGTIKSKFIRGMNVFGLKSSQQFKVCADFIPESSVTPPSGQAQPGSQNPGSNQATVVIGGQTVSRAEVTKACNTIYNLGQQKVVGTIAGVSSQELEEGKKLIALFEGFIPTLRAGYDKGFTSIGFGTLMSGRLAGTQPTQVRDYLVKQQGIKYDVATNQLLPAPKSVWKKYSFNKVVPGNYTSITKAQAFEIMEFTQLAPKIKRISKMLKGTDIKLADHQIMAILSFSYQMGRLSEIIGFLKQKPSNPEIYSYFLRYGSGPKFAAYRGRRMKEVEYFLGNKSYKYTKRDHLS
tara:strand:+ start:2657 stop:3964 length:1308 start_codon:yes stop_codon:yes gene_type:complete